MVPMTRSDPDEATAALELAALVLLLVLLLLLLLLQAAARATTAALSADARSSAVLRVLFIAGSTPRKSAGWMGPPGACALAAPAWRESWRR